MSCLSHPSKGSASAGDSRVSNGSRRFASYDNLIFVTIEGQRIAPNGAVFGIDHHRRAAGQNEFAVRGRVDQVFASRMSPGFLDYDVVLGDNLVQLRG